LLGAASQPPGGIPPALERAEALAEAIQDDIDQGAWATARAKEQELRRSSEELDATGVSPTRRSALANRLDFLVVALAERSRPKALTAANRVSRVITDIMAAYPTPVPIHVAYMDVGTRDVLYNTEQRHWRRAAVGATELIGLYADVQSHVRTRDPALDGRVVSEIDQLRRAIEAREQAPAATVAKALLDEVDRIEQSYPPPPSP
jgi:hypothetical protein